MDGGVFFCGDYAPLNAGIKWVIDPRLAYQLRQMDFGIANLEGPLTKTDFQQYGQGKINLRLNESSLHFLKKMNIQGVCLANNHMFDCGVIGFEETIVHLDRLGFEWFGAGLNLQRALEPLIFEANGVICGVYGFCSERTTPMHLAGTDRPGVAPLNEECLRRALGDEAKRPEKTILYVHWGEEYHEQPSREQLGYLSLFAELGVDYVFGHHAHVIQPDALLNDIWISFGLGNLVFDDVYLEGSSTPTIKQNEKSRISKIVAVEFISGEIERIITLNNANGRLLGLERMQDNLDAQRLGKRLGNPYYRKLLGLCEWIVNYRLLLKFVMKVGNLFKLHKIRKRHFNYIWRLIKGGK